MRRISVRPGGTVRAQLLNPSGSPGGSPSLVSLEGERMRRLRPLIVLPLLLLSLCALFPAASSAAEKLSRADRKAQKEAIQKLPEKYRQWLKVVDLLISEDELRTFLALDKDYQRDAF